MSRRVAKRRWVATGRISAGLWRGLDRFGIEADTERIRDKNRWHHRMFSYPFGFRGYYRYGACPCDRCKVKENPC